MANSQRVALKRKVTQSVKAMDTILQYISEVGAAHSLSKSGEEPAIKVTYQLGVDYKKVLENLLKVL